MAAPRARTRPSSSPVGDEQFDEPFSDEDLCGGGCFGAGAPADAHTVSCEHGTYKVTETTKRATLPASRAPETVHDRSVHFESEQSLAADSGAINALMEMVNRHEETILKLGSTVRQLQSAVTALTAPPAAEDADGEPTE